MSFWTRMANVVRGERLNRAIDEELESHIEEAIAQGRDPIEARKAFGSALRHREGSRDVRLVSWLESLRTDAIFGWRQLKKTKITSAAAILSLALAIGACTSAFRLIDAVLLRPLPVANPERLYDVSRQGIGPEGKPQTFDGWAYPDFQLMRAAVKDQAELFAVSYAEPVDLTYKSDEEIEKAYLQYVSGWMFTDARSAAGFGASVYGKRRSKTRRASLCRAVLRLLDASLWAGFQSNWANIPDGERALRDRRGGRGTVYRNGARNDGRYFCADHDASRSYAQRLDLAQNFGNAEAGGGGEAGHGVRTDAAETGGNFAGVRRGASQGLPRNAQRRHRKFPEPEGVAGAGGIWRFGFAVGDEASAGDSRRASGVGAANCLRERGEPDDGASLSAGARNGRAGLDGRRTSTAGAAGAGAKRVARSACCGRRRIIRVVVGAVRRGHDQSAGQSGAADSSGGWASVWFRLGASARRDFAFWTWRRLCALRR